MINGYEINGAEINGDATGGVVLYAPIVVRCVVPFSVTAKIVVYSVFDGEAAITPTAQIIITNALSIELKSSARVVSVLPFSITSPIVVNSHLFDTPESSITWSTRVLIGGADFSARLAGSVRIERQLNGSALADIELAPQLGAFTAGDYDGKTVDFYYSDQRGEALLFRGTVIRTRIDQSRRLVQLTCSDLIQEAVDNLTTEQIDTLIDHARSPIIYTDPETRWDYAQQCLSSAEGDFFRAVDGQMRFVAWGGVASVTLGNADIFDGSLQPKIADRHSVLNEINIEFEFNYLAGWQRRHTLGWHMGLNMSQWVVAGGGELPTREMIANAIPGDMAFNWVSTTEPASGVYHYKGATGIFKNLSPGKLLYEFVVHAVERWLQNIQHRFSIRVQAPTSIDRYGKIDREISYRASIDEKIVDWHQLKDDRRFGTQIGYDDNGARPGHSFDSPTGPDVKTYNLATSSTNRVPIYDQAHTPEATRNAIKCAIREARKRIIEGNQINAVDFETPIQPFRQLADRLSINSLGVSIDGRVTQLKHTLDIDSGDVATAITVTAFANTDSSSTIAPPVIDDTSPENNQLLFSAAPPLNTALYPTVTELPSDDFRGYVGNRVSGLTGRSFGVFPQRFTIEIPEVDTLQRDRIEYDQTSEYSIGLDLNTLNINIG